MARSRNIKPSFFDNDILAEFPPLARLLFIGLWCLADREGRLEDRPKRIKKEVLGYDDCDCDTLLQDLHKKGFIVRYTSNGNNYIQIINFAKHQNPHIKESPSVIPAPTLHHTSTVQPQNLHGSSHADTLIPLTDTLIPLTDTLIPHTESPLPITPEPGGTDADEAPQTPTNTEITESDGESLTVETAGGAGNEKPVDHSTTLIAQRFTEFWKACPKKTGKGDAEKSWKKIKPTKELFTAIMTALSAAKQCEQWNRDNGRYIPNPSTWLNQKRWEDEYIPAIPQAPFGGGNPKPAQAKPDTLNVLYSLMDDEEGAITYDQE